MQKLLDLVKNFKSDGLLIRNTSWLLGTEVSARFSRIVTIVAMAANLNSVEYGTAMLALAFHDVMRLILKCGAGAQIVQCSQQELADFAGNGGTIQWLICTGLAICQFSIAPLIGGFYDNVEITRLIQWMAPIYLLYPLTSINVFMVQRENKMRFLSLSNGSCIIAENLSTALLLALGFGLNAIVIGKLISALLWVTCFAFAPVKRFRLAFNTSILKHLFHTSGKLFGTEISKSFRLHADLFIAGKLLAPELFGIYSFAKSAGIGLSQSLNNAYNNALFPYICRLNRSGELDAATPKLTKLTGLVSVVFICQAMAAPIYVPLLFGNNWNMAIQTVSILCLAASMNLLFDTYCNFCRAAARYQEEFIKRCTVSVIGITIIVLLQPSTPIEVGFAVLIGSSVWPLYFVSSLTISRFTSINSILKRRKNEL